MIPGHRLVASDDFRRVRRDGNATAGPGIVVYYSPRAGGNPRFGFVVGRRVGGAVTRNRVKRLLREAARHLIPRMTQPADVVIVASRPVAGLADAVRVVEACAVKAGLL